MTAPLEHRWRSTPLDGIEIEAEVSRTPAAAVFLARRGGRRVALKVFSRPPPPALEAALRLSGPWVAELADVGCVGDQPAVVGEWVDGVPLSGVIAALSGGPRLGQTLALRVVFEVCRALTTAHELEDGALVHGALDLSHVLCGRDGAVKVCGFGGPHVRERRLRASPGFVAPEVLGGETPDVLSDVYAAGALGYLLLTGRTPAEGALANGGRVPAPSQLNPGLDVAADGGVLAAVASDPGERAHSARLLTATIDRYLEEVDAELDGAELSVLVRRLFPSV